MKYILILSLFISNNIFASAVTYTFSGGRFGDNLLAYCHAKWVSYKFNIPLLYKPFLYSDQLAMHSLEKHYEMRPQFQGTSTVLNLREINPNKNILYIISYFPESIFELIRPHFSHFFIVDWHDEQFKKELCRCISPLKELQLINPPTGYFSVAVHVRKGTGYDIDSIDEFNKLCLGCPVKCPPDSFYIEQIKKIRAFLPEKKLYIFIFTDHDDPSIIAHYYKNELKNDSQIVFDYRKENNRHDLNVLEDFFSLLNFDCLIRGDSNYSFIASKIGNHKLIFSPVRYKVVDKQVIIDEVNIACRLNIPF